MIKRILSVVLTLILLLIPSLIKAQNNISISNPACHSESFASCHSEHSEESLRPFTSFRVTKEGCHSKRSEESFALLLRAASEDPSLSVTDKQAESNISVLDSSVEVYFPNKLLFNLEAESYADIVEARLYYQGDKMNYAQVTSEGWADFIPAAKIRTSWVWDMRRASLPPGTAITYWWTIEDAEGRKDKTPPSVVYFDDLRYHWQSLTSDDLTLSWYEGDDSFAQELMDACEEGLARLTSDIGTYPKRPIKIYIYASARDLQGAMIFPMEWTGGVAFTEFGIIAIGVSPSGLDWGKRALVHELTHLVVHQATFSPYGELPTWLDEGLAMYNEGELGPSFRFRLDKAISEDKLISVRSLCSPFSAEPEKAYISYAESYSLVEYLLDNYGQDRMLNLLTLLKQGTTYDEALTKVYGFDIDGLDARWRGTLTIPRVIINEAWQSHPALIAVLSALATVLALAGALALEERTWRRS